jgi:hypothetical protein
MPPIGRIALSLSLAIVFSVPALATPFVYYGGYFDQVNDSAVDWGDYDADGDLDLVLTGMVGDSQGAVAWIYRNEGAGSFTRLADVLTHVYNGSVAWGDYDNDGDLDLAMTGKVLGGPIVTKIYRNDGGNFVSIAAPLDPVWTSSVAWGDHDRDGDLDLLVAGNLNFGSPDPSTRLYRNDEGSFVAADVNLPQAAPWGSRGLGFADYDTDGDLDVAISGRTSAQTYMAGVYASTGLGVFYDSGAEISGRHYGSLDWGDMDLDGDLDLVTQGYELEGPYLTEVYRNDGGAMTLVSTPIVPVIAGTPMWGDADNDGDLDLLNCGMRVPTSTGMSTKLYRNDLGSFVDSGVFFEGLQDGALAWGDYDGDGDLDVMTTGVTAQRKFSALYRNDEDTPNTVPSAPAHLSAAHVGGLHATFAWDAASDAETATPGLTYNLRVGTTPGAGDVMSAMSLANGRRQVVRMGNVNHNRSWTLLLPPGTYYWSVQAVDAAFAGGPFASEQTLVVPTVDVPTVPGARASLAVRAIEPNPSVGRTVIEFELPRAARATLRVFDVSGRTVRTLSDATWSAGRHQIAWNGDAENGASVRPGVYLVTIEAEGARAQRRLVRLR